MSKNELSIKSKLLFNQLDMHYKILINLENVENKRLRSVENIFSTYRLTINPFIKDELKEYQEKVYNAINRKQEEVNRMIYEKATTEVFVFVVSPVLEHLKDMIRTCRVNLDKVNELWEI